MKYNQTWFPQSNHRISASRGKTQVRETIKGRNAGSQVSDLEELTKVAPDGDLILLPMEERSGIQVHSLMLISASSVFKVMLSDQFSEGRRLRESDKAPMRLELPEDDYSAVLNACWILHGQDGKMRNLTAKGVEKLAILIDKYDMSERFFFAMAYWMKALYGPAKSDYKDCWSLMTAAYMLSLDDHFFAYSAILVRKFDSCAQMAYGMADRELGLKLCCSAHHNLPHF